MNAPGAEGIFERHHLAVFRFLRRMTGQVSLAEDLTQEVFLRVVRRIGTYQDLSRERSWVFRITRNVLMDDRRRTSRAPLAFGLDGFIEVAQPAAQGLATALQQALQALPEEDREAFLMREVGGLGYEEIAEATGATHDAARMRIYRARRALRVALSPVEPAAIAPVLEV
jgi:RNA polymerase sigma factor (sigma-70 family)